MANYFLCMCLLRIVLPICLTSSIIFRPSLLSAMYLLLLFYLPIVPVPTPRTMSGHTGCYLKIVICISFVTSISQLAFQIVLLSLQPYAHIFTDCDFLERILRHVGFIRLNNLSAADVVQWLSPEIIMLFSSIAIYVGCSKLTVRRAENLATTEEGETVVDKPKKKKFGFIVVVGRYVALASLCIGACLRPSVLGGFYFLVFLGAATWWACYMELRKAFAIVCRIVMVVLFFHISVLYAYQFQWPQEMLEFNSTYSRYFGLTQIMSVDCSDPRSIIFNDLEWASYLNPIWLMWLYYILGLESKLLLMPQAQKKSGTFSRLDGSFNGPLRRQMSQRLSNRRLVRAGTTHHRWQSATRKVRVFTEAHLPSEKTPLIRGVSPSRKYGSGHSKSGSILQDSTGSVTITADGQDDIPMQPLGKGTAEEELQSSLFENIVYGMASIFQVLVRSSYIATNITMMVWSITYNSWLTFVLLLWANILWLLPNQRRAMLYSAPVLVIYAELLLISQYIFGMDLTEDELPQIVNGVDLKDIGFEKVLVLPVKPLLARCLYTTIFWITLRQFMHERQEARQTSALADMVAPLQVSVGTAAQTVDKEQESKGSKFMKTFGDYLKQVLTKFWIWVVAINLFIVAITGERMTAFRIIYMFLFLIFILMLQLSFKVWRKVIYGFWFLVIAYSMLTLVLVYTYQLGNFPDYWTNYLHIPIQQQLDIGLEKYETKQLFVRLLTPTFFVVICVIQVHYFHKDFLAISKIRNRRPSETQEGDPRSEASSAQGGPWDPDSEKTDTESIKRPRISLRDLRNKVSVVAISSYLQFKFQQYLSFMWLFFELHMFKIVLLIAMLLTVYDVCAIHFLILLLAVVAVTMGTKFQTVAIHLCSIIVSIMLLLRMIYQIKYIDHYKWDVVCDNTTVINTTTNGSEYNNANWLGFRKIEIEDISLPSLVKWYIGFILAVTLRSIILIRQRIARTEEGKVTSRPFFMFPKITRVDADKNVRNCLKYLANYGFYKFGVEICLMATVALIGTRMDFYAVLYGFWLCAMFMMTREKLSKIWKFYLAFIAIMLPVQYFMVVGLPPELCIFFPWDEEGSDVLKRMQDWMFLLGMKDPPLPHRLICDIVVLILVARQAVVFRIEQRYAGQDREYPGGSNESIIHLAEEPGFINPLPDFITYVRTWLDIFKRGILSSFMWITLAIVFLAGTNRVNLFSLGYLAGSFIFLWQGSDLYLRPIPKILKPWNWLLGYNVFVIIVKTVLQIPGCIFINDIAECWLLRLFGIGCIKKFVGPATLVGLPMSDQCMPVPREDIGLAWDGLCFGFLLMQRRIFNSYNFFHIIDEAKATTILASRGADLIEELREKQMGQKGEQERKILEKIKLKMDKIKANQQKIQGPSYKDATSHFVEEAPMARSPSLSSCTSATSEHTPEAGYHTPIEEEDDDDDDDEEEDDPPLLTPRTGSLLQTQAPTPCSALMTVSLDAYLEPQRISFSSPPNSELNPRAPSLDDSFPVFSPPPYDAAVSQRCVPQRQTSIGPPWMQGSFITPRQSIISYSSRSPQSHHTYKIFPGSRPRKPRKVPTTYREAIRSGDYYMFDDLDDDELDLISEKDDLIDDDLSDTGESKMTVGELLSNAMKTNIETALRRTSVPEVYRRASMPLARQRSCVSTRSHLSAPLPVLSRSEKGSPRRSERGTVTIKEEVPIDETDEPKPGSSKQQPEEEMSLLSDLTPKEETTTRKIFNVLLFIWTFLESIMNTLTNYLNKFSRDYRYVLRVLSKEKKQLKERTDFRIGHRRGSTQLWEPVGSFQSLIKKTSEDSADVTASEVSATPADPNRRALFIGRSTETREGDTVEFDQQPSSLEPIIPQKSAISQAYAAEYDRRKASVLTVPEIRILAPSLERGLDDSPRSGSPVDIMVDYETAEMSSVDQPPIVRLLHAIWFAILSHSDVVCYFIIFLNQMKSASIISLPLPLMVFLWGTLTIPRPSKTFWITIIAYTEVIVLIKCVFQFKILDDIPGNANNPFHPPRIIGIERTNNYATYDLLLLLVVFFHRLMLKTLGLWKTSYEPQFTIEEGIYKVDDDDDSGADLSNRIKMDDSPKRLKLTLQNETLPEVPETDPDPDTEEMPDSDKSLVRLSSVPVTPFDNFPGTLKMAGKKYTESVKTFFELLLDPTSRITADVYAYMFMCDFFNFMVVIFGFAAFGTQQGDGGVSAYLQENKVPIPFLLMLILQFVLIIVDRALFLRKYILGKIVFQFLQIIGVHICMFFVLPAVTERSFNARLPPQMWYMVKCFYLLLSAYQIRCGYPTRILGNFVCKGYNYVNMFLFKGFMAIPFLFELRTIMDWMWTDTSMTIFDWLKMEDIFAHIFQLKCTRHVETEYPQPRGEKKKALVKYFMGGAGLFAVIAVIWFPLVFFALGNTVGEANIPYDVTVNVRIGPYQPIYSMSAQSNAIYQFNENEYNIMKHNFNRKNRVAQTFLSSYEHEDVAVVKLNGNSTMVWAISPPDMERMLEEVISENPLVLRLNYIISRLSNNKQESGIISSEVEKIIQAKINGKPNPSRQMLYDMLSGRQNVTPILIERVFPKFVKVTNRAIATPVTQLLSGGQNDEENSMRNLTMKLSRSPATVNVSSQMWWELKEDCTDPNYINIISHLPNATCSYLVMYTFNEKTFPASLSFLSGGGIIGLYTTLVFVASRVIRGFFSEICFKIMFDDMPNVDRILQLCLDIYLVREARELCLEEDLFAKVVFLFRSPETLIKWTRPKEDDENEGDDPDDEPQAAIAH